MTGGAGNDTYVVDNTADKVIEAASGGADKVESSVTFTLAANVENLTLTGASAIDGAGNALANRLIGNAANNKLDGGAGADSWRRRRQRYSDRGRGADVLEGGLGNDYASPEMAAAKVTASLANTAANTGDALGDTYDLIEHLQGSNFNDYADRQRRRQIFCAAGLAPTASTVARAMIPPRIPPQPTGIAASLADPKLNTGEKPRAILTSPSRTSAARASTTCSRAMTVRTVCRARWSRLARRRQGFDHSS